MTPSWACNHGVPPLRYHVGRARPTVRLRVAVSPGAGVDARAGCPGLRDKQPELPLTASVGDEHTAATWPAEVQYRWLDCEVNPATGTPFFNEVVFHHAPTATLFVTDAFWNYPAHRVPPQTWLWKQVSTKLAECEGAEGVQAGVGSCLTGDGRWAFREWTACTCRSTAR